MDADVVIEATSDVAHTKTYENGVVIEVERNGSPVSCSDMASPPVDGILISVSGSWKRISYKQTFLETQKCFAIFGSVPSW